MDRLGAPDTDHPLWAHLGSEISERTGADFSVESVNPVAGGCINHSAIIAASAGSYFVKLNTADRLQMFEAEAEALKEMSSAAALRVPEPVCSGSFGEFAWLVLENLGRLGAGTSAAWGVLGAGLAKMHRCNDDNFGWHRNNTIGSTTQINTRTRDWIGFLREQRLGYQLALAARNGYAEQLESRGRLLLDKLDRFFIGYDPVPSLLHGDLWSGNVGFDTHGGPVVFDPASYYGDREADIAMTELFGGFPRGFYRAYEAEWPLDDGYSRRKDLYNLYHLLNHLNLFGGGYLGQCRSCIDKLLEMPC